MCSETIDIQARWSRPWDPSRPSRLLLVGCGDLAARTLTMLAASGMRCSIGILGRTTATVDTLVNLTRQSYLQCSTEVEVVGYVADLEAEAVVAEYISDFAPDLIFNTASIQAWHEVATLPPELAASIARAHFGPWLPMHLSPMLRLMSAVSSSRCDALVVNAAYPDAVNPVLAALGVSPHAGIGNVANPTQGLRLAAAESLGCRAIDLTVRFVAHHYTSHRIGRSGNSGGAPYLLRFECDGADVTPQVGNQDHLFGALARQHKRPSGKAGQTMTAASAVSVLRPLLDGTFRRTHSPGLDGRVGGYPVVVDRHRVTLDLPSDVQPEAAHAMNRAAQTFDGIESITADGTAIFTDQAVDVMYRELHFYCKQLTPADAHEAADELRQRYLHLAKAANG